MTRRLLLLSCCALLAGIPSVIRAEPPRLTANPLAAPSIVQTDDGSPTIRKDFAGLKTLVIVESEPRVRDKNGNLLPLMAASKLKGEYREVAESFLGNTSNAVAVGDTLYVGINGANKHAQAGTEIIRISYAGTCANNSTFSNEDAPLTLTARERIKSALHVWTIARHTVPDASLLAIHDTGTRFDVQLDFRPVASRSPEAPNVIPQLISRAIQARANRR